MGAVKLLLGGSPCTYWSIAQSKNREVTANGKGWELFHNYVIAIDKYKPDYFLYENNKSMAKAIREQITATLGVEPVLINSARVSAQNRERLYWCGRRTEAGTYERVEIPQPEDRGIMLADVLEKEHSDLRPVSKWVYRPYFGDYKRRKIDVLKTIDSKKSYTLTTRRSHYQNYICTADRTMYFNLSPEEFEALQTLPKGYTAMLPKAHRYSTVGNGWTVEVIAHILRHFEKIATLPVEVLSIYDGISCGHVALDRLSVDVRKYFAMEIDKYAIACTQGNYPDTIQLGDAFQVRDEGWYC